jgi:hypothetical protein
MSFSASDPQRTNLEALARPGIPEISKGPWRRSRQGGSRGNIEGGQTWFIGRLHEAPDFG